MKIFIVFKNQYFWLTLIVILGLIVRLYKIDSPIADWHSWRQADTVAVTRNFIKEGFNPFLPKYDDMSGVSEKPIINTNRFRFVEFPIYNIFVYPLYLYFGINDSLHRLVSVIFSLGSIVFVFLIAKRYLDILTSLISAAIFAFLPFNVFFSRTTLPEPTFVFFALGMMYFVDKWIWESKGVWGMWGFVFTAIAFLIKPWAIFFFLPIIYSAFMRQGKLLPLPKKFIIFTILSIIPFILWRLWILQQPEGTPASNWLLNGDGIRFRPAFSWWIISERMGREILGVSGIILFVLGILTKAKNYFLHIFLLSIFLYFVIFATGNVRHNYYQILFVPIAAIFVAIGFTHLFRKSEIFIARIWTIPLAMMLLILTFYFTYKIDKEFYKINNPEMIEAGKMTDRILPKDAIVLAPYNGDTAFLYQTNRPGFPNAYLPIKEMVADYGVTSYISTTKDAKTKWVIRHFKILIDNGNFVIADLTKINQPFNDSLDPEQ